MIAVARASIFSQHLTVNFEKTLNLRCRACSGCTFLHNQNHEKYF